MLQSAWHARRAQLLILGVASAVVLISSIILFVHPGSSSGFFAKTIPGVALVDDRGKPFSLAQTAGTPYALFFGYTHCPDVCPTTLAKLARAKASVSASASRIVFVTVDPSRDTPPVLHRYVALFGRGIIGVTGQPASLKTLYNALGIWSVRIGNGPNYEMGHTSTVFFVDGFGRVRSLRDWADPQTAFVDAFKEIE